MVTAGAALARDEKRSAPTIMDVVSADSVGRFPDANAAEALRRVPGVSMEIDQGEGRFVVVRGIDASLNNVTLNGQVIGTPAEFGTRGVSMDAVPADLISRLEVVKAVRPDMDANAIGAAINIETLSAFDMPGGFLFGSLRTGYNDMSGRAPFTRQRLLRPRLRRSPVGCRRRRQLLAPPLRVGAVSRRRQLGQFQRAVRSAESSVLSLRPESPAAGRQRVGRVPPREAAGREVPAQSQPLRGHRRTAADRVGPDARHADQPDADQRAVQPGPGHARIPRLQPAAPDQRRDAVRHPRECAHRLRLERRRQPRQRKTPFRVDWEFRSGANAFPNSYDVSDPELVRVMPTENFYSAASYPFRRVRFREDIEREDVISRRGQSEAIADVRRAKRVLENRRQGRHARQAAGSHQ